MKTAQCVRTGTSEVHLRIDFGRAKALAAEAAKHLENGETSAARILIDGALALAPTRSEFLRLSAITSIRENRVMDAIATLQRAIEKEPASALLYNNLGSACRMAGDEQNAVAAFQYACTLAPHFAAAWLNLGKLLKLMSRSREADQALERAIELRPDHVPTWIVHAENLKTLGRTEASANAYRQALSRDPAAAHAWWGLANLKTEKFSAADARALEAVVDIVPDDEAKSLIHFALAKALEDNAQYGKAMLVLERANALRRPSRPWDARRFSAQIDSTIAAFHDSPSPRQRDCEIVFIVSLPRSGSTLAEQILASHSKVEGGGELSALELVVQSETERRGRAFPYWVGAMTPSDWRRLGEDYLVRTAHLRAKKPISTDKGLQNWQYLGAAALMLPGARFVHCSRDALETGLSCYRQWFNRGQNFSYDLGDIAEYVRDHQRLMRHWALLYESCLYTHELEGLQIDMDASIRKLLGFAGLDFEDQCLRYYKTERNVRTASAAQVRLPIHSTTARARLYGESMEKLRTALFARGAKSDAIKKDLI